MAMAGIFEAIFAWILPHTRKIFSPVVSGLIVMAVAAELGLIGLHAFLGLSSARESVEVVHIAVSVPAATMAILTISVMIAFAVWGRGLARLLCGLIGLTTGLLIAVPMGLFAGHDLAAIEATRLFTLPIADYPCIYQRLI